MVASIMVEGNWAESTGCCQTFPLSIEEEFSNLTLLRVLLHVLVPLLIQYWNDIMIAMCLLALNLASPQP